MPRLGFVPLAAVATLFVLAPDARAQIPDEFTNLELLDPEIEKEELVGIMKEWASSLGVRCAHCHAGPDNLRGMDFASDEKATKRTARRMLQMSRTINQELLRDLPVVAESGRTGAQAVSCYTCHRGMTTPPRRTVDELLDAATEGGPQAVFVRFGELDELHADAGRYDLRPSELLRVASLYHASGDDGPARETLKELLERFPQYADAHATLAQIELDRGNLDAAEQALDRATTIEPDNGMARWLRGRLAAARAAAAAPEAEGS